jgi:hypothetical protein
MSKKPKAPSTTGKGDVRHSGKKGRFDIKTSSGRFVPTRVVKGYAAPPLETFPGPEKAYRKGFDQTQRIYHEQRWNSRAPRNLARAFALETIDRKQEIHTGGDQKKAFQIAQNQTRGARNALKVLLINVPGSVDCAVQLRNPYNAHPSGNNSCLGTARKLFG